MRHSNCVGLPYERSAQIWRDIAPSHLSKRSSQVDRHTASYTRRHQVLNFRCRQRARGAGRTLHTCALLIWSSLVAPHAHCCMYHSDTPRTASSRPSLHHTLTRPSAVGARSMEVQSTPADKCSTASISDQCGTVIMLGTHTIDIHRYGAT